MDIHVSNLPFKLKENQLQDLFTPFGTVEKISLIKDHKSRGLKGYGFITMGSKEEAEAAIAALNGTLFMERPLKLSLSQKKVEPKLFFRKTFKKKASPIVYGDKEPVKRTFPKKRRGQGRGTKY